MDVKPVHTSEDHTAVLMEIDRLWGADQGTPEGDKLDVLLALAENYEGTHYQIDAPDPIEFLATYMLENELSQVDLGSVLGSQSLAVEVMRKRRVLNLSMIQKLTNVWNVPADPLIHPYHLED